MLYAVVDGREEVNDTPAVQMGEEGRLKAPESKDIIILEKSYGLDYRQT